MVPTAKPDLRRFANCACADPPSNHFAFERSRSRFDLIILPGNVNAITRILPLALFTEAKMPLVSAEYISASGYDRFPAVPANLLQITTAGKPADPHSHPPQFSH